MLGNAHFRVPATHYLLVPMTIVWLAGCGGSDALKSPTAARLKGLATMYLDFIVAKGGKAPTSEAELKKHMQTVDRIQLNMAGIEFAKIDEAFVSLRDKEPFVVVYGVNAGRLGSKTGPIIAYEKTGVRGKHLVANVSTQLDHVNEDRLKDLINPKN